MLKDKLICTLCDLSIWRRCAQELFNFTFEEKKRIIRNTSCNNNSEEEVIRQLLERIKALEEEIEA